jgi:hypothetical protein
VDWEPVTGLVCSLTLGEENITVGFKTNNASGCEEVSLEAYFLVLD